MRIDDEEVEMIEEIDESDIEERLKFKISWRSVLKVVFVLIIAGVIIYYIVLGGFPSELYVYIVLIVCIIGGAVLISFEFKEEDTRQTVSTLKCLKCGFQKINSFTEGDYVFKMKGKCPECDENLQIVEIYSVNLAGKLKEEKEGHKEGKEEEKKKINLHKRK
jgi:Na+(H+)/acetate symporter ActP